MDDPLLHPILTLDGQREIPKFELSKFQKFRSFGNYETNQRENQLKTFIS
jgi:hypothetical protein